jgi:hypothetical protein
LLLGLLKETTLVFLLLVLVFRLGIQLRRCLCEPSTKKNVLAHCLDEAMFCFLTLSPLMIYLLYRMIFGTTRKSAFGFSNLCNPTIYPILFQSFWEQCGVFCLLSIVGCCLQFRKHEYLFTLFSLAMLIGYSAFYILDDPIYTGYSRFNLMLIPVIVILSVKSFASLAGKQTISIFLFVTIILSNLFLSPINADGSKKPLWGNKLVDTSEHYYPYNETLAWVKKHHGKDKILFSGMYYPYCFSFYFNKLKWYPQNRMLEVDRNMPERDELKKALDFANGDGIGLVVFQFRGDKIPEISAESAFYFEKIITNQAHSIGILVAAMTGK